MDCENGSIYINYYAYSVHCIYLSISLSFSMSLRFDGHFSGGPGLAGIGMSPFRILLQLTMTEMVSLHLRYLNAYFKNPSDLGGLHSSQTEQLERSLQIRQTDWNVNLQNMQLLAGFGDHLGQTRSPKSLLSENIRGF